MCEHSRAPLITDEISLLHKNQLQPSLYCVREKILLFEVNTEEEKWRVGMLRFVF